MVILSLKFICSYYSSYPTEGARSPARGAAQPRIPCGGAAAPPAWYVHALFSSPGGWRCVPERTAPGWGGGRANEESRQTAQHRHIPAASVSRRQPWRAAAGRGAIYLRTPDCGGRMAGGRRGLVAPQNTFLENIVRRSNGKNENVSEADH